MRVNVVGGVTATKLAAPHMLERGNGSIIFTSSGSSLGGDVTAYSYGASKAALNWYVQAFAATFGKKGVRSNAILPGPIQTPSKIRSEEHTSEQQSLMRISYSVFYLK